MSETVSTVSRYLAVHKQKRNELRRELLAVEQQIRACEEWIVELGGFVQNQTTLRPKHPSFKVSKTDEMARL